MGNLAVLKKLAKKSPVFARIYKQKVAANRIALVKKTVQARKSTYKPKKKSAPKPKPKPKPKTIQEAVLDKRREVIKKVEEAKKPKTLTKQQYVQETYDTSKKIGKQVSQFQESKKEIVPFAVYKYEGRMIYGATLKKHHLDPYERKLDTAYQQSQKAYIESINLPEGTTIKKSKKGYSISVPDQSLKWTKDEFKKIDKAYEINPVLGGVAEFGFGAVSSIGALIKPALDYTVGTEYSRQQHFVSPLDVAFEPVGWSPKGSTDVLKSRPVFTAGGVASEIVQSYAMTQAMKPISKGASIGAKGLVKRVPSVYGKFTKVFPEERFISGGIKGTRSIIGKGSSELPENVYRWGAKGYRRGLQLTSAGVKTPIDKSYKGVEGGVVRNVVQKTKYGRGGVKRIWLSPSEYTKVEKDIAGKLALKKTVDKSFQSRIRAGVGEASELIERDSYRLSWGGKRLVRKYKYTRQTWKVGKEAPVKAKTVLTGTKGSIVREPLEGAFETGMKPAGWYGKVRNMYRYGYSRTIPTETGNIVSVTKGFGQTGVTPIGKKWISRYRPPFLKNVQAQTSVLIRQGKQKLSWGGSKLGYRGSVLSSVYTKTVPSSMYSGLSKVGYIGFQGIFKTMSASRQVSVDTPKVKEVHRVSVPSVKSIQKTSPISITVPAQSTQSVSAMKVASSSVSLPKYEVKKPKTVKSVYTPLRGSTAKTGFGVPWFPKPDMYGSGAVGYGGVSRKKKYRLRVFDVGSLFENKKGGRK